MASLQVNVVSKDNWAGCDRFWSPSDEALGIRSRRALRFGVTGNAATESNRLNGYRGESGSQNRE